MIPVLFLIAAALGALSRATIGGRLNQPGGMAWGTLVINVTGSFALGCIAGTSPEAATVIGTGLLGAFTTFSSFARDVVSALELRQFAVAGSYLVASVCGAIGAAWLGLSLRGF